MENKNCLAAILGFAVLNIGCVSKPFQPPPPDFKVLIKVGSSEDDVKRAMLACGYPNVGGFAGIRATVQEKARAEQCMFRQGFRYKDGWGGTCSLKDYYRTMEECKQ